MLEEVLKSLMKYAYYDETKKKIVVLDEDALKELYKADEVKFKEEY